MASKKKLLVMNSLDLVSTGQFSAAVMAVTGFFLGLFLGLATAISNPLVGVMMIIGIPIFYGILGFISGLLTGLVYNLYAARFGGIKYEVTEL
ncbi:MAG: hypothetical protein AABX01_01940 [Candidatus Micrarchaeota archaeon]